MRPIAGLAVSSLAVVLATSGCPLSEEQKRANAELVGVWHVSQWDTTTGDEYDRSLVGLAQRPDGRLTATHVDLRGSGLVWIGESDVTYEDGIVGYEAPDWGNGITSFTGRVDEDRQRIIPVTEDRFRRIWRRAAPAASRLVQHVDSILASPDRTAYAYHAPEETGDGWVSADLAEVGCERERITELVQRILAGRYGDIHSLLIVKDGRLVLEEHFRANGALHSPLLNERYRNRGHHLASTTKSVTSLLVGIAIDQGLIEDLAVPVLTFFPQYDDLTTGGRNEILVRHLLTMTAGLDWEEDRDVPGMWGADDVVRYYLAKPVVSDPGSEFTYANGNTTTLGAIVASASGVKLPEFAERFLFAPLGITDYHWQVYSDSTTDADGGLGLRARDLAKLGQLVLQHGEWNGVQVVSADWVRESTAKHMRRSEQRWYGYSWWQTDFTVDDRVVESVHAWGWGGQFVFVFPALDLVIVSTGGNFDWKRERHTFRFIETHILPALLAAPDRAGGVD